MAEPPPLPKSPTASSSSSSDDEFFDAEAVSASGSSISPSASSSSPPSFNRVALTEKEILDQVTIKNIDTGETMPLSQAESLTRCDPLSLHLKKITGDYISDEAEDTDVGTASSIEGGTVEDENLDRKKRSSKTRSSVSYDQDDDAKSDANSVTSKTGKVVKNKVKAGFKKVGKVGKTVIQEVKNRTAAAASSHKTIEVTSDLVADPSSTSSNTTAATSIASIIHPMNQLRLKVNNKKGPPDFAGLMLVQELNDCRGAVWCMKWSPDGQLLAVAGQDQLLRVYCCCKAWKYFTQLRNKASGQQISPSSTRERTSLGGTGAGGSRSGSISSTDLEHSHNNSSKWGEDNSLSEEGPLLLFAAYRGHTADVLDISWSKNHFLLSSSMDKTVRLWHATRVECLCTLRHTDFVTTISFHPKDDRYFLSGSLDGKLRLWNIPDKRVTLWNEVSGVVTKGTKSSSDNSATGKSSHGLITASAFVQNGKFAVIGTYDGRVIFYNTDQLKYFTQLHVRSSSGISSVTSRADSSRSGRNRKSNKVTGIESVYDNKILVTTNDSRIRLYDLRDLSLACKYKGYVNESSQIRASVSHDHKYILCGSENASFYVWRLQQSSTTRKDRNNSWESVRILNSSVGTQVQAPVNPTPAPSIITAATFAPAPKTVCPNAEYVIIAADFQGVLRLFAK